MVQFQPEFEALGGGSRQDHFGDCESELLSLHVTSVPAAIFS